MIDSDSTSDFEVAQRASANYIKYYADNNLDIYKFMDHFDIGKSSYGKLMDAAANGKHVIAHRLYGHHIIYNFPIHHLNNSFDFLEHLFSDLFTRQGLPIIPGELIKNKQLLKACSKLKGSWNFINGFGILAGTISIYSATKKVCKSFRGEITIETFEDIAKTFGIGALELAISLSTANPFLLIGAIIELTSGIRAFTNSKDVLYFSRIHNSLSIEFCIDQLSMEKIISSLSIENEIDKLSIENEIEKISIEYEINNI
ncbi:MAG: hypothetical protein HQK81_15610 [Desulfovibrionaceae bacterium]|nr:hypothetical protein [Desulfovibrionaceae bacterium]